MPLLPSRTLAALVAAAGLAFLVSGTFALLVNVVLAAVVVFDGVALYRQPLPRVIRRIVPRVALGHAVDVDVEVHNPAAVAQRVSWTDDLDAVVVREGSDVHEVDLPPYGWVQHSYRVHGAERGRTALGDVHLRVLGPLRLLWRRQRVRDVVPFTVQPGLQELQRHRLLALQHRSELGAQRVREIGEGRDFERLREYVQGDDPRRIDWKATARRGQPIVRQYEAERSQSIFIAVDAGRLMMERFDGRERLDHALAAALVLADAAAVHGDAIGALLFADTVQAYMPPARQPLGRVADLLASVEARRVEPDYPAAFRHLGRKLRRRSLVVLFTDVIDRRASAALLEHLGLAARRHVPLIVALRNVELEAAAAAPASDDREAYRRAAAEELLQARALALAELRRRGVLVADVRPDAAVDATLSRYLEVKRRGLL